MKRKVLALDISIVRPCVFAQGSSVTVYGTFNVDFENIEAEGAVSDLDSRNRVQSNSSNIGFRGTEDLGNGLKAIFQCESGVSVDTGAASTSSGTFRTRNSTWD